MKKTKQILYLGLLILLTSCSSSINIVNDSSINNIVKDSQNEESSSYIDELDFTLDKNYFLKGEIYSFNKYEDYQFTLEDSSLGYIDEDNSFHALKEGSILLKVTSKTNKKSKLISLDIISRKLVNSYRYYDFDSYKFRRHSLDSLGKQNIIVIPVSIKDFEENATKENLNKIKEVFNGEKNSKWESVKSFYKKSSYGKLDLNFLVADEWFSTNMNPSELAKHDNYGDGGSDYISEKALEWYKEKYKPYNSIIDQNKDGYIDSIWLIYDSPNQNNYSYTDNYKGVNDSTFWAYTAENYNHYQKDDGNIENPVVKIYAWASIDFINNFHEENTLDAHTYIHETGHLLGLNDYYSTYGSTTLSSPFGCIDMMDNNVGDHNAFSKFALGWVAPTIVEDTITLELDPFENNGNFILVKSQNFNNTAFDEYFTIEYITPTGLNELDYTFPYANNGIQGYSEPGIRITHVDARLTDEEDKYVIDVKKGIKAPITNTNYNGLTNYYDVEKTSPLFQLTLMQKNIATANASVLDYSRKYQKGLNAKAIDADDSLFHTGDFFHLTRTSPYRVLMPSNSSKLNRYADSLDEKDIFSYRIKVESLDENKAIVSFLKIATK